MCISLVLDFTPFNDTGQSRFVTAVELTDIFIDTEGVVGSWGPN